MGKLVSSLFGGGDSSQKAAMAEAQRQRELGDIERQKQAELLRAQEADTNAQTRATGRPARGGRLLLAAGDQAGGLATKLGG